MPLITAVIPAYNEAARIIKTLNGVKPYVDEIIVIDDGSTDNTADLARKTGAKVLRHATNRGYIDAIKYGLTEAKGDIVVMLDADGEFSADDIPRLLRPIIDGHADMVQGHRDRIPRPSEKVLTWLAQRKADVGDSGTGLRASRTGLAKSLSKNRVVPPETILVFTAVAVEEISCHACS
jgi:glycosyltransferase involved in cell wall biosynthesis